MTAKFRGIPMLFKRIDPICHWAIAVGCDYRNRRDPKDLAPILADPYDRYDDYKDRYSIMNANCFYWMWFDALYFGDLTWRTKITTKPKVPFRR